MCIYIYIYMYVCMYIYIYICIHIRSYSIFLQKQLVGAEVAKMVHESNTATSQMRQTVGEVGATVGVHPKKCGVLRALDVKNVGQHIYIYIFIYICVVTHKHQCLEKDVKKKTTCGQLVYDFLMFFMLVPRPLRGQTLGKVREIQPRNGTSSMDGFHSYKPPCFLRISMGHVWIPEIPDLRLNVNLLNLETRNRIQFQCPCQSNYPKYPKCSRLVYILVPPVCCNCSATCRNKLF